MNEVRSVLQFSIRAGHEDRFEEAFSNAGMLTRPHQVQGFLQAELVKSVAAPTRYLVIGRWASAAAYDAWRQQSGKGAPKEWLRQLGGSILEMSEGEVFEFRMDSDSDDRS